jgi:hypothetical protein
MALQVKFHDFKKGLAGAGSSSAPASTRIVDHLGPSYRQEVEGYLTFDNSYPTGGYPLPLNQLGLTQLFGFITERPNGYGIHYNRTTNKVQVFNGTTEVAGGTDLSSLQPAYFKAFGV